MAKVSAVGLIARRFLLSKVSDRFLSFIALISMVGVALGVLALTVVTSVINGFEGELVRVVTSMNGDVLLYVRPGETVQNPAEVVRKVEKQVPELEAITASFVAEMMISGPQASKGMVLEGIDFSTSGKVTQLNKKLESGRLPTQEGEVAVGSYLAERIGAKLGSEVRLIAPFVGMEKGEDADAAVSSPKVIFAHVVGIVHMGMHEFDSKFVFAPLGFVQKSLDHLGEVTAFKLKLNKNTDARLISNRLGENFGYPFRAKDWGQQNKNLLYAIQLEKIVIAIILTVIVIVAAFNVVSTLMMMIHDKTKEIAILKAMGFRKSQCFGLFCYVGMGIGVLGVISGVVVGLGLCLILAKTHLIQLPADVYYISFLPVVVNIKEVMAIAGVALLVTFLATLYPAYQVTRRSPLEGLRYE